MRTAARAFGILLVIAGVIYGAIAIYFLSNLDGIAATLEMSKVTKHKEFGFASIGDWKRSVGLDAWLYLTVGLAATVCGTGIAAGREWARMSWLVASTLILGFVLFVALVSTFYFDLLAFAVPSFVLLRRNLGSTKNSI